MRILLFGATGMVGQGVLRECLRAPDVELVQTVGRTATGQHHPKLRDACFFCLGVPSVGLQEAEYTRLTHDLTLTAAQTLARLNPQMTFVYVSGAGTDSTERGRSMWARVKGCTVFGPKPPGPVSSTRRRDRCYRSCVCCCPGWC